MFNFGRERRGGHCRILRGRDARRSTEVSLSMIPCLYLFDFAALASKVIQ